MTEEKQFYWVKGNLKTTNYLGNITYEHYTMRWEWRIFFRGGQDPVIRGWEVNEDDAKDMAVAAIKTRIMTIGFQREWRALDYQCPLCSVGVGEYCVTTSPKRSRAKVHFARLAILRSKTCIVIDDR